MEDNKDFLTEETEGTADNNTTYADTEEPLEKTSSSYADSFSEDDSFSEFESEAGAAEESEFNAEYAPETDNAQPPKKKRTLQFTIIISAVIVLIVLGAAIACRLFFANGVVDTNLLGGKKTTTWHYKTDASQLESTVDEAQIPDYYFVFEPDGKLKVMMGSFEYLGTYTIQNVEKQDIEGIEGGESKVGQPMLNIENSGIVDGKFLFDRSGNPFSGSTLKLTSLSSDLITLELDSKEYTSVKLERSGEFHKDDKLLGSWSFKNEVASQTFVFNEDGTYDLKTDQSGAIYNQHGLYDCNDGILTITVMAPNEQSQSLKYSVTDDKLSLTQIIEYMGQTYEQPLNDFTRDK